MPEGAAVQSELDTEYQRYAAYPFDSDEFYDRVRSSAPVYRTPLGYWWVTRHDLVGEIVRDDVRFSSDPSVGAAGAVPPWVAQGGPASRIFRECLVFVDGSAHTRLRRLVREVFTPRFIRQYTDQMRATVSRLLDEAVAKGEEGDFLQDFSNLLPTTVILELIGLSQSELERFHTLAYHFLAKHFPVDIEEWALAADPVVLETAALILERAEERRKEPTGDLLSALANVEEEGDRLSDDELVAMVMFLVIAGYETTANTLANGVHDLLRFRDQWEALTADPALVDSAVEEILRFEGSVRNGPPRFATEDVELAGATIPKGDRVYVCLAAANRDPAVFEAPGTFDITRSPNPHLEFSQGAHFCLGHALARLEMKVALEALISRFPDLGLVEPTPPWKNHFVIRGFESLPVRWNG